MVILELETQLQETCIHTHYDLSYTANKELFSHELGGKETSPSWSLCTLDSSLLAVFTSSHSMFSCWPAKLPLGLGLDDRSIVNDGTIVPALSSLLALHSAWWDH